MKKQLLFSFAIILFNIFHSTISEKSQHSLFVGNSRRELNISCQDDNVCLTIGPGRTCVGGNCKCVNETECEQRISNIKIVTEIGEKCHHDENCNIDHSFCKDETCQCEKDRVPSEDKRTCLKVSDGLGHDCEEDLQCMKKIENSQCKNKKCVCHEMHHKDNFKCWPNHQLGAQCTVDEDCTNIEFAICSVSSVCQCMSSYIISSNRQQCLKKATKLNDTCVEAEQCRNLYGNGAICWRNKCECDQVHRYVNKTSCPTKINRTCDSTEECQSYQDDASIHCNEGKCQCSLDYEEIDGVCSGYLVLKSSTLLLLILLSFLAVSIKF